MRHNPDAVRQIVKRKKSSGRGSVAEAHDPLANFRDDFEALVTRMQTHEARVGAEALFAASGKEIGALAQAHARGKLVTLDRLAATLATAHAWDGTRLQVERKQKAAAKKRLIDQMLKSTARASAAIDDAVAYVEASNKKIARAETKKKKLR